ncbi:MAG: DUF4167 domain-containing protein [Alphaproteobacteria bacterium]|nr:DUF4167 domain-containing protein [Alphaproteobacteria bacterium]
MINNRQPGRRRGRNNPRPQQGNGRSGDSGNRIDNRARGNATQLLEKYKNQARDAQMQGDRVNAEYYLQFADHYFRVLADNRVRQEEQQPNRRPHDDNRYDGEDEFDGEQSSQSEAGQSDNSYSQSDGGHVRDEGRRQDQPFRHSQPRREREPREPRERAPDAAPVRAEARVEASPTPVAIESDAPPAPRAPRQRRPRKEEVVEDHGVIDAAILPPSISKADNDSDVEDAPAPRKRTRRVRPSTEAAE